jgi:hypothetical protein
VTTRRPATFVTTFVPSYSPVDGSNHLTSRSAAFSWYSFFWSPEVASLYAV